MANVLSIVSYKIFPAKFGGQKGIASFNEYFSKYHSLFCLTVKENEAGQASYPIINKLSNSKFRYINVFYFFLVKKIIKEKKITHVIIEHPYYGWLGFIIKRFCDVRLIIHSHNIEAERFKTTRKWWWKILSRYEKFVHEKADHTFCISENDRRYFVNNYKIAAAKITVITYGIPCNNAPALNLKENARTFLLNKFLLNDNTKLYLFNGALAYKPNFDAVKNIIEKINPLFIKKNIDYRIIICGNNLPAEMNGLKQYENIIYAGFVDDISMYFLGADVFINPVTDGGGIKTKLVEALGYGLNAVSTFNGAIGVDEIICNGKLLLSQNEDWQAFAKNMVRAKDISQPIGDAFFNNFYWDNIAAKAANVISNLK